MELCRLNLSLIGLLFLQLFFVCYFVSQILSKEKKRFSGTMYIISLVLWIVVACILCYLIFAS